MTESQVLQSTQALKALENTFPGKIPQSILSPVTNTKDPLVFPPLKKKVKKSSSIVNNNTKPPITKSSVKPTPKSPSTPAKKGIYVHIFLLFWRTLTFMSMSIRRTTVGDAILTLF